MIELKPIHRHQRPNPRVQEITIRKDELPALPKLHRGNVLVSVDGEDWFACPGIRRHDCDCSETGAQKGDWILRIRR